MCFFVNFQVILSVVLTAVGVVVAAIGDFSFDLPGYTMALTSVFFQVSFCTYIHIDIAGYELALHVEVHY